jgi:GNAT superfamily N-acetyltransferase
MENANIEIEMLQEDDDRVIDVEILRHQVFHLKTDPETILNSYHLSKIRLKRTIPFALFINGEMAAGCYITGYGDTLMVDYLFVNKIYRNTGLRLGRVLLSYVFEHKASLEEFFHHQIQKSILTALDSRARHVYEQMGFTYSKEKGTAYMSKKI